MLLSILYKLPTKWLQVRLPLVLMGLSFVIGWQFASSIHQKNLIEIKEKCRAELVTCQEGRSACDSAIIVQNHYIDRWRVDTLRIAESLSHIQEKYSILRETLEVRHVEDYSDEQKFTLIDSMLRNFFIGRMYSQGNDYNNSR